MSHLLLLLASLGSDLQAQPGSSMNFIDAHSHVWTPDTARYPLAPGYKKEDMKPASFTADELLAHARPAGVTRVALIQMSFYGFDTGLSI